MARIHRTVVALLCVLMATAACDRDAGDSAAAPAGPTASSAPVVPGAPSASGPVPATAPATTDPSAPPIVTGTSKPPGGGGVAAAPPPCSELKPVLDRYLTGAKVTREAPGGVTTCFVIGQFQGSPAEGQLRYGHSTADKTVRKAAGVDCAAEVRPLELHFKTALGCDNATAAVHSGVALAQGGSFAAAIVTLTGGPPGTPTSRAAVSSAAQKLAADVLTRIG